MSCAREYHLGELTLLRDTDHPRRVLPAIKPLHRRILDVGCGAGQTLLANGLPDTAQATGVDTNVSALQLGRQLTQRIRFVLARGERLPFRSGSFDLVVCRVALPYMKIPLALSEMCRVLSSGGDIWLTVHPVSKVMAELKQGIARADARHVLMQLYVLMNGAVLHLGGRDFHLPFRPGRRESFQTETGITRVLEKTGFRGISIDRSRGTFVVQARKA